MCEKITCLPEYIFKSESGKLQKVAQIEALAHVAPKLMMSATGA